MLLVAVGASSILSAASISQRTQGSCSNAVVTGGGNVTITCTGIKPDDLDKLVELFNSSVQLTKEFYQKTLDALAKKELNTEEIRAIIALRYKAIFASAEEDAERWGKRLESASDRQSEVDFLAADGRKLAERIILQWQPVHDFILKIFDDRILELEKRGLLMSGRDSIRKRNLDLIAVDRAADPNTLIREVSFPNGARIRVSISQGQIHRGKYRRNMRLWIDERVNGINYAPLNMFFDMKQFSLSYQGETVTQSKGMDDSWDNGPLNNEQIRKLLILAIGQSLEFVYVNDRSPSDSK